MIGDGLGKGIARISCHNASKHLLAPNFVSNGCDPHSLDAADLHDDFLDFHGRDVLPASANHVFFAIHEVHEPIIVNINEIARVEVTALPRRLSRLFVFQVSRKKTVSRRRRGAPHEQLTRTSLRHVSASIINQAKVQVIGRAAKTGRAHLARLLTGDDRHRAAGLGHRPSLNQAHVEPGLKSGVELTRQTSAKAKSQVVPLISRAFVETHQHGGHDP